MAAGWDEAVAEVQKAAQERAGTKGGQKRPRIIGGGMND